MTSLQITNLILHARLKCWLGDRPVIGSVALDGHAWPLVTMDVTFNGLRRT